MKKLLFLAVASFAMAAVAVDFSPTIGVTQVTTTNKNTIVAVPFNSLADGGNMSVTNLVCTNGLDNGTHIYVFKGGKYKLLGIAKDSETLEKMVVYQALYGEGEMWVRPYEMFFGTVERDGKVMQRFTKITEEESYEEYE